MDGRPWLCLFALLPAATISAQTPDAQPASFTQPATQALTFGAGRAKVGQRSEQTVLVELSLKTRTRLGNQIMEEAESSVARRRRRVVEFAEVEEGRATAAYVRYPVSDLARSGGKPAPDAIAGKQYLCKRLDGAVHVLTRGGEVPPQDEFELVSENMETLGLPNPMAEFLSGQHIAVGQRLTAPPEVAQQLVGLNSQLGEVKRFELTLREVVRESGRLCGLFDVDLEAQRSDSSQLRLIISGTMVIEAATSRAVRSELTGPIGMSHSMADPQGRLQVDSTGKISLRVAAQFQHAQPAR